MGDCNDDEILYFEIEIKNIDNIQNIKDLKNLVLINVKDITSVIKN